MNPRMFAFTILSLVMSWIAAPLNAQSNCDAVLRQGVMDTIRSSLRDDEASSLHTKLCSSESNGTGASSSTEIGVEYGGVGAAFGGSEESVSSYRRTMCDESNEEKDIRQFSKFAKSTVNPQILEAWNNCRSLEQKGIKSETSYSPGAEGVSIGLWVSGSKAAMVSYDVRPLFARSSIDCSGELAAVDGTSPLELAAEQKFLSCNRRVATSQDLSSEGSPKYQYSGEFDVLVRTTSGQIRLLVPASQTTLLSQEATDLRAEIDRALPLGAIISFGGHEAPAGWALANGKRLSRAEFSGLFRAIGLAFTPESEHAGTTFALPDLRGYFVRGFDPTGEVDKEVDRQLGSKQAFATAPPQKAFTWSLGYLGSGGAGYAPNHTGGPGTYFPNNPIKAENVPINGGDIETRPVNISLNYIIKIK